MRFPHGPGAGFGFYPIFVDVMAGLVFLIGLAIVVGLIVLLVRFLLVATKAAEIYVARNRLADDATPVATPTTAPVVAPVTTTTDATTTPVRTTPVRATPPRTRTPKPPTTPTS